MMLRPTLHTPLWEGDTVANYELCDGVARVTCQVVDQGGSTY